METCHQSSMPPPHPPPPYTDKRSGNERMMIKVRYTACQRFACVTRAYSDFMEEIYCKKYQWGPKIRN